MVFIVLILEKRILKRKGVFDERVRVWVGRLNSHGEQVLIEIVGPKYFYPVE